MLRETAQNEYLLAILMADITEHRELRKGFKVHYARKLPSGRMTGPICGAVSRVAWQYGSTLVKLSEAHYCRKCRARFKMLPLTLTDAREAANQAPSSNTGQNSKRPAGHEG